MKKNKGIYKMSDKKQLTAQIGTNNHNFKVSYFMAEERPYWESLDINNNLYLNNGDFMKVANRNIKQEMFENENFQKIVSSMSQVNDYIQIFNDCCLGYEIVLAGGAVRDTILGSEVKDADFFIRLIPLEKGILDIKKNILDKYQDKYPNNPFIEFLKKVKCDYFESEKRKESAINIFELDINEYLKMETIESRNSILEKVIPYINNLKEEKIIIKDGALVLSLQKNISEEVVEMETTLTVFSLLMTLVKDVSTISSNMFLQLTSLRRDFIRDVSYLRFSTRKIGAILKIDNNAMPIDLIFETGNSYPMESFDWSLNKVGVVMQSVTYKELSHTEKNKFLNENRQLKIDSLNKETMNFFYGSDNYSEYLSYDIDLIEKVEIQDSYDFLKKYKYFLRLELPPITSCKDVIERVVFNQCFIESIETRVINYKINFNSFKKIEYEMIDRKNKLLMKYPYFDYKYEWHELIKEAVELIEYGDFEKDKSLTIEPAFYDSIKELIKFKEAILMKDDVSLKKEDGLWVFDKKDIKKIKPRKF